ncbi:hypothetical protein RSK60_290010 [Ralstonia solanacearum K60]|nr:hypothetical protein RSK60_290010 [Ralstonia solanacearum K60]
MSRLWKADRICEPTVRMLRANGSAISVTAQPSRQRRRTACSRRAQPRVVRRRRPHA